MKGMTLWTISAPGCFGVQAKRAIDCAVRVGQIEDVVAGGRRAPRRPCAGCATAGATRFPPARRSSMNLHAQHDRRRRPRHWARCRRAARPRPPRRWRGGRGTSAAGRRGAVGVAVLIGSTAMRRRRRGAAAQQVERPACSVRRIGLNQFGSTLRWPSERIDQAVGGVGHEDEVVVEEGLQPRPTSALHPVGDRS